MHMACVLVRHHKHIRNIDSCMCMWVCGVASTCGEMLSTCPVLYIYLYLYMCVCDRVYVIVCCVVGVFGGARGAHS